MPEEENGGERLKEYEDMIKKGEADPYPYDRLMIAYRKEKAYKDELRVIKRALEVFGEQLKRKQPGSLKGNRKQAKIKELSMHISRRTGLTDKKGKELYLPEPLNRWTKRKAVVEEKIKKQK